jgi:hypothetical protein
MRLTGPSEGVAASCTGLHSRARCSGAVRKCALTRLVHARPACRRFRTATRGRAIAEPGVAARVGAAGCAGPRAAGGLGWICDAWTAVMSTMRWWTGTVANYRRPSERWRPQLRQTHLYVAS